MDNYNGLANFTKAEVHTLEEDQLVCDKCNGTGCIPSETNPQEMASVCQKCQGDGWVDWLSNITGKPSRFLYCSGGTSLASTSGCGIPNFIVERMAQDLADKIDKEILDTVITT